MPRGLSERSERNWATTGSTSRPLTSAATRRAVKRWLWLRWTTRSAPMSHDSFMTFPESAKSFRWVFGSLFFHFGLRHQEIDRKHQEERAQCVHSSAPEQEEVDEGETQEEKSTSFAVHGHTPTLLRRLISLGRLRTS